MYEVWVLSLLSVALVSLLSLVGIATFLLEKETQRGLLIYMVSFSVGGLFGGAFFHLIPEASAHSGFTPVVSGFIMLGILVSFFVEQVLKWRHCHVPTSDDHPHSFAYMNLIGDSIHNMIDGIVIGGSYLVSTSMGMVTTLAVCMHELPQEIGDFGVLVYAGFTRARALKYNFLTALTAFAGVAVALTLSGYVEDLTAYLVPFAAGNFIYIAGSDLIPELHAEEELGRTLLQLASMLCGVALLFLMGQILE
ncbi:ZIP family metal transporter [Candidatus Bathyarchaeota archaeon]|nr:ZIP family metal transporter [Candidatus Bathyarchaeota archaeon]